MAMVIVLSVLNGFSSLINLFFNSFDPDLKITAVEGKMFEPEQSDVEKIKNIQGVIHYAEIIEEMAMLKLGNNQYFATVKGVPSNYSEYTQIDSLTVYGEYKLEENGTDYAVIGQGVAWNLSAGLAFTDPIQIIVPKKGRQMSLTPAQGINYSSILTSGIFSVLEEIDSKYILVPFNFARNLFESGNQVSSIELGLNANTDVKKIQEEIQHILGNSFSVKTKYQQHGLINKTLKTEKLMAYLILVFILVIASFNILGSLSMLIIDKKEDMLILKSMGASSRLIRRIFIFEGWLISVLGALLGAVLGTVICWVQIKSGIIPLPGNGSFVVSAYPVQIIFTDIIMIIGVVLTIGFLAAVYPVKFISNKYLLNEN
jgi:lipoprotein-releasing system permease protein